MNVFVLTYHHCEGDHVDGVFVSREAAQESAAADDKANAEDAGKVADPLEWESDEAFQRVDSCCGHTWRIRECQVQGLPG